MTIQKKKDYLKKNGINQSVINKMTDTNIDLTYRDIKFQHVLAQGTAVQEMAPWARNTLNVVIVAISTAILILVYLTFTN